MPSMIEEADVEYISAGREVKEQGARLIEARESCA